MPTRTRCGRSGILAPGAEKGQPAQTIVAAYARLLTLEAHKDAPGELHAFLRANPPEVAPFFQAILTDAAHATWLGDGGRWPHMQGPCRRLCRPPPLQWPDP